MVMRGGQNGVVWLCVALAGVESLLGQVGNVSATVAHKTSSTCATWTDLFPALGADAVVFLVDFNLTIFAIHDGLLFW